MTQPAPTPAPAIPEPTNSPAPAAGPPPVGDDKPLGPAGERALAAEREARKELEKKLAELAPLKDLAATLAGKQVEPGGPSEVELLQKRFADHEQQLAEERQARWRAEVAAEKGLTAQQAERLRGATRDELVTDADQLLALFPTAPVGPRTPAPDPSQGARGGQLGADLDARIAEATKAGDWPTVIALKREKTFTK